MSTQSVPVAAPPRTPWWLLAGFWVSIAIAVAVVLRRLLALAHPSTSGSPAMAGLDEAFASHTALTLAHIVPALLFVAVLPFAFLGRFRTARWPRQLLYPLGLIVGLTAYAMSAFAIGGWIERSAVLLFNTLFLFCLAGGWSARRTGASAAERRWMTRAVGILLGIATTRPVMGVFFATSALTHLAPRQFFGLAFWIGFSINTVAVELWVRRPPTAHGATLPL